MLCEKVMKVKKFFNKLTTMENEKNNLVEALKLSRVEIFRSLTKLKALEKELTMCKQIKEQSTTSKLDRLLKA
jgi:chemotaxis methyl-accepting protein methylase